MLAKNLRPLCGTSGPRAPSLAALRYPARAHDRTIPITVPRHHARLNSSSEEDYEKREFIKGAEPKQNVDSMYPKLSPVQRRVFDVFCHLVADVQERKATKDKSPVSSFLQPYKDAAEGGEISQQRRKGQSRDVFDVLDAAGPPVPRPDSRFDITVKADETEDLVDDIIEKSIYNLERLSKRSGRVKRESETPASNPPPEPRPIPRFDTSVMEDEVHAQTSATSLRNQPAPDVDRKTNEIRLDSTAPSSEPNDLLHRLNAALKSVGVRRLTRVEDPDSTSGNYKLEFVPRRRSGAKPVEQEDRRDSVETLPIDPVSTTSTDSTSGVETLPTDPVSTTSTDSTSGATSSPENAKVELLSDTRFSQRTSRGGQWYESTNPEALEIAITKLSDEDKRLYFAWKAQVYDPTHGIVSDSPQHKRSDVIKIDLPKFNWDRCVLPYKKHDVNIRRYEYGAQAMNVIFQHHEATPENARWLYKCMPHMTPLIRMMIRVMLLERVIRSRIEIGRSPWPPAAEVLGPRAQRRAELRERGNKTPWHRAGQ
ncbi:hypothetical protein BDW74DRAFT_155645 [Aspergillus multicolor]|uniref:uncharacterized protein n=1 Tax=Aspergillus multicolor TaxID=41759 RepID=UPI003CCE2C5D